MNRQEKAALIKDVNGKFSKSVAAVVSDFSGLTVEEVNELRVKMREHGVDHMVVKNTLAKRALEGTEFEGFKDHLEGPCAFSLSYDDPAVVAKVLHEFAKDHEALEIRFALMAGNADLMSKQEVGKLAKLPSKDVLIGQFASALNSPIVKLVQVNSAILRNFVLTLEAVRQSKEGSN